MLFLISTEESTRLPVFVHSSSCNETVPGIHTSLAPMLLIFPIQLDGGWLHFLRIGTSVLLRRNVKIRGDPATTLFADSTRAYLPPGTRIVSRKLQGFVTTHGNENEWEVTPTIICKSEAERKR